MWLLTVFLKWVVYTPYMNNIYYSWIYAPPVGICIHTNIHDWLHTTPPSDLSGRKGSGERREGRREEWRGISGEGQVEGK